VEGATQAHVDVEVIILILYHYGQINIIFPDNDRGLKLCLCPCRGVIAGKRKGYHKNIETSSVTIDKPGYVSQA